MDLIAISNETLLIAVGALAGGFVNGLTGMGTALTALGIWLQVLPPTVAAPLAVLCSVVGQLQNLPSIWHTIDRRRLAPFIAGGVFGVPVGTHLLGLVPAGGIKLLIGGLLLAFCGFMLLLNRQFSIAWGGRIADGAVGLVGGVLGGLAGLSGVLPTMWAALRGWTKEQRRGVFQGFNLSLLSLALVSFWVSGFVGAPLLAAALIALPATVVGSFLGYQIYRRLSDRRFDRIVLLLMMVLGGSLVWSNF